MENSTRTLTDITNCTYIFMGKRGATRFNIKSLYMYIYLLRRIYVCVSAENDEMKFWSFRNGVRMYACVRISLSVTVSMSSYTYIYTFIYMSLYSAGFNRFYSSALLKVLFIVYIHTYKK
jgi:hypothetical protein